jgi:hypothetical protein
LRSASDHMDAFLAYRKCAAPPLGQSTSPVT